MNPQELEVLKKQILDAVAGQEDKLVAVGEEIDAILAEAQSKFETAVATLDANFAEESAKAAEENQDALQQRYRVDLQSTFRKVETEMKQKLSQILLRV